ncbi:MAG: hypothetical protein UMV23_07415 [Halanaerobium sp.]|nr:hypothetical protein [Halanaerobium sp.]
MSNAPVLISGELNRMKKYHILSASLVTALIWIGVLYFIDIGDVTLVFPLLLFIDVTTMSALLVGVSMFFEKQEGSIKSLLIAPISKDEYILAKTFGNIFTNLFTLTLLYLYVRFFKEIHLNILAMVIVVIFLAILYSLLGFLLTYSARDFTGMLMGLVKYALILILPVVLEQVGMIQNQVIKYLLFLLPTKSTLLLLLAPAGGVEIWKIIVSIIYTLLAIGIALILARKKFAEYAVRESGV